MLQDFIPTLAGVKLAGHSKLMSNIKKCLAYYFTQISKSLLGDVAVISYYQYDYRQNFYKYNQYYIAASLWSYLGWGLVSNTALRFALCCICHSTPSLILYFPFITHSAALTYVTVSAKTVLIGTFSITRKTDLKYSSCFGSVVLDFSHTKFTV